MQMLARKLITVTARPNARNVFVRSDTGIVGSNPTRGMDVCVYSVTVLSCAGSGLATGRSPVQGVLLIVRFTVSESTLNRTDQRA
jgi:hypothetical protein